LFLAFFRVSGSSEEEVPVLCCAVQLYYLIFIEEFERNNPAWRDAHAFDARKLKDEPPKS
jgi:hypothetical protein